jgi:hypothetical protein
MIWVSRASEMNQLSEKLSRIEFQGLDPAFHAEIYLRTLRLAKELDKILQQATSRLDGSAR